jgi:DNA invertase Pin-like site-specific DNA recombinase
VSDPNNNPKTTKPTPKFCFSYIRFSRGTQAKGNSTDRQLEIAPRVARDKGWELDGNLSIADLGLSAFKKANLGSKGKLGAVLTAVQTGKIPKGSVMILEALDRLTRAQLDEAYDLFRDLLRAGLEIYVDKGGRHYTKDSLKNPIDLLIAIVELNAANEFSALLAERVGKAWRKKRENLVTKGERLTTRAVGWVDRETWKPIPQRVAIVKRIFKMYDQGHGISTIVRHFNREKVPTWGDKRHSKQGDWNSSYVSQLLHSRAVIGEFQPHVCQSAESGNYYRRSKAGEPIANYYPTIIDRDLFFRVQGKLGNSKKAARTDRIVNLFSGVAYCECGSKMYLANSMKKGIAHKYYTCWGKLKGLGCNAPSIRYEPIEAFFLALVGQNAHKLFADENGVAEKVQTLTGHLREIERQIETITAAMFEAGVNPVALVKKQAELEREADRVKGEIEIAEAKLTTKPKMAATELVKVTITELSKNANVRRQVREFILGNVERMTFSKSRGDVGVQFKSDSVGKLAHELLKREPRKTNARSIKPA